MLRPVTVTPASPRPARAWDIVLFGATGFAGRLVAAYLDEHAPPGLRLALAGRNRERLAAIAGELRREFGVITASVDDDVSLHALAGSTRVLLTTVGPYAQLGEPVVAACVAAGTDYVDLTGEPAFVDRILARHDAAARASGALIVHCCGFDSIPTDLGVL
ncbi:MAG: saccharopine dehydrogenase NADP-binding domain-containing protein, partial [Myxococcales bacterium]|nr:saccharopine dehydrogenase NADP-binding domain-containing protein [Myxococcales bacterium]